MAKERWTDEEAREVLEACRQSGMGMGVFGRTRGFSPQRLGWWKKKLGFDFGKTSSSKRSSLVSVEVMESVSLAERSRRGDELVMVLLRNGHRLQVGRGFDEHAFMRAVSVLEGRG